MKHKNVVLYMALNDGIRFSSNELLESASRLIYSTINKIRPHYIVFFTCENYSPVVDLLKEVFLLNNDELIEDEDYELVILKESDNFNHYFDNVESKIWESEADNPDCSIMLDYTFADKTMAIAMSVAGTFYKKEVLTIGGVKDKGMVSEGTEYLIYQNFYKVYNRFLLFRIKNLFNGNRFISGIELNKYLAGTLIDKESILNLSKAYFAWDNVNFNEAYNYLNKIDLKSFEDMSIHSFLKKNLKALGTICKSKSENLRNCYILASLINNSKRRAEEYKYDDAIARLYRAFELIAQIRLDKYRLTTSNIDINILREHNVSEEFISALENTREDGKIKIGLIKDFLLLNELGDDLGKYFIENRNLINDLTQKRNNSILAHGLDALNEEDFNKFLNLVESLAKKLDKDMNKFLKETQFGKLSLKE